MGTILRVECLDCSYSTELFEGMGMLGVEMTPTECRWCRELVTVPISPEPEAHRDVSGAEIAYGRCGICRGDDLLPIAEFWDGHGRLLECPKCRGRASVDDGGIWD